MEKCLTSSFSGAPLEKTSKWSEPKDLVTTDMRATLELNVSCLITPTCQTENIESLLHVAPTIIHAR